MTIRQYAMLRMFDSETFNIADCLRLNQTTFGSVVFRGWVKFDANQRRFILSKAGQEVYSLAKSPNLFRLSTTMGGFSIRVHIPHKMMPAIERPARAGRRELAEVAS